MSPSSRYLWLDLAAGPPSFSPGPGRKGGVLPHSAPHPQHYRPKALPKALVPDLAALACTGYGPPLQFLPPADMKSKIIFQVIHMHDTLAVPSNKLRLQELNSALTAAAQGLFEVEVHEVWLSWAMCTACVAAYSNALRVVTARNHDVYLTVAQHTRSSWTPACCTTAWHATGTQSLGTLGPSHLIGGCLQLDGGKGGLCGLKPHPPGRCTGMPSTRPVSVDLPDTPQGPHACVRIDLDSSHRVLPVFLFHTSDTEQPLLLSEGQQAAAYPDMVIAVSSRASSFASSWTCHYQRHYLDSQDVTRPVLAAALTAAKQKSSAAVQAFKAAFTTGRDRAAAKRKEQMEDPATVTQFAAVFYLLKLGRPMTDIEHTPDLLHHFAAAKQKLTAAAQAVVQDLRHRFVAGRLAKALAIVYYWDELCTTEIFIFSDFHCVYWDTKPSDEDFLERLEAIKQLYCQQACLSDGTEVPPLLCSETLATQQSQFAEVMRDAANSPGMGISQLWQSLSKQPMTALEISEYGRLAELAMVMVPGSVEEERMFSAMAYLKDDTRNRLNEEHLNACARAFHTVTHGWGLANTSTAYTPATATELNHMWLTGSTPFGPLGGQMAVVPGLLASLLGRNHALAQLNASIARLHRVLQGFQHLSRNGRWDGHSTQGHGPAILTRVNLARYKAGGGGQLWQLEQLEVEGEGGPGGAGAGQVQLAAAALGRSEYKLAVIFARSLVYEAVALERLALRISRTLEGRFECSSGPGLASVWWAPVAACASWPAAIWLRARLNRPKAEKYY
ncbi:hypothetical protein QJQ45_029760 [Haematococcus lacustris]|nr:hypothetical protein QJQ45_029760 [Haematococcus lacustris]